MYTNGIFEQMEKLNQENWEFISGYLANLITVIGKNPIGGSRRVLDHTSLIVPLGYNFNEVEHQAFLKVLNSLYGEFLYNTFKRRATFYLGRLLRVLERFPSKTYDKRQISEWLSSLSGLLRDMDALIYSGEILKEVEHFASSTLSLSRFITTWHDPELVTALYLLEMSEREGRGATYGTERYLIERAKHELEVLIDPSSRLVFTEFLDDEANIWWGLFKLLHWELDGFELHTYRGISGFLEIVEKLVGRKSITFPKGEMMKREITFEVQGEYKTILSISSTAFMLADLLQDLQYTDYAEQVRSHAMRLQEPYLLGQKVRNKSLLYFRSLESEVWGRVISWRNGEGMTDFRGQRLKSGYYQRAFVNRSR